MTKMFFSMDNKFTPEQIEKIKSCKTVEEVTAFAEEINVELTNDELKEITGGATISNPTPLKIDDNERQFWQKGVRSNPIIPKQK